MCVCVRACVCFVFVRVSFRYMPLAQIVAVSICSVTYVRVIYQVYIDTSYDDAMLVLMFFLSFWFIGLSKAIFFSPFLSDRFHSGTELSGT